MVNRFARKNLVRFARFRWAERGVVAVEFALILPAMLTIWFGMIVAADAVNADRRASVLSRTLSDLASQYAAVSQSDLDAIFGAARAVLWPVAPTGLGMRLSSIDFDGAGNAWLDWSGVPSDPTMRGTFAALSRCTRLSDVPPGLSVPRTSVIRAEVNLKYTPSLASQLVDDLFSNSFLAGKTATRSSLYMRPRQVTKVTFNPALSACPGYTP